MHQTIIFGWSLLATLILFLQLSKFLEWTAITFTTRESYSMHLYYQHRLYVCVSIHGHAHSSEFPARPPHPLPSQSELVSSHLITHLLSLFPAPQQLLSANFHRAPTFPCILTLSCWYYFLLHSKKEKPSEQNLHIISPPLPWPPASYLLFY